MSDLKQLAQSFAHASEQFVKSPHAALIEGLRAQRLNIVAALLEAPVASPETLRLIAASCFRCSIRMFPRNAAEDTAFAECLARLATCTPEQLPTIGLAGLLLAWHVFELDFVPQLAALPEAMRSWWLPFLFETPQAFTKPGHADAFARYLHLLCTRIGEFMAKGDAADVLDEFDTKNIFLQAYFNELNLKDTMRARGRIIEGILERGGAAPDQLRVMRPIRVRPRIGFIILGINDGTEAIFMAAHMEHLDRRRYDVRLYSLMDSSGKLGVLCEGWAEAHTKLSDKLPEAVAQLRRDDLDMAVFCTNLTAVPFALTKLAAHRVARIQVSTIASPITTGLRNIDVMISGGANETEQSPEHYTERLVLLPGALNCYPFQYVPSEISAGWNISRAALGVPEDAVVFFSSANFYKLLPELTQQWVDILSQVPGSYLILMPFNPNWMSQYPKMSFSMRLAEQAKGKVEQQRFRLLDPVSTLAQLHKIIGLADVYLDAFPFSGACSIYDPLTAGVPVVARAGTVCRSRHSKAILEQEGLGDWVMADGPSYVARAIAWGRDAKARAVEHARVAAVTAAGLKLCDTAAYAAKLMPVLDAEFAAWNRRVSARNETIGAAPKLTFTDQNLAETIVLPYLRGGKRMIDVGACMGAMARPFLMEGWQVTMFEPDARCHEKLTALATAHNGRLEKAVASTQDGIVSFHVASVPGLSGLSVSPFAPDVETVDVPSIALADYIARENLGDVDFIKIDAEGHDFDILRRLDFKAIAPRLIMVEFGEQFAGQDRDAVTALLAEMRGHGYRAAVFGLRAKGSFERHEWSTEFSGIGIDEAPDAGFGNILFFRAEDRDFLPSLSDWLEQIA